MALPGAVILFTISADANQTTAAMARKKQSPFEDLIEIASRLPWKAALVLAFVAYLGFHYVASLPPVPIATADMKSYGQSIGNSMTRQLFITFGMFLQYIVPVAFLVGAVISFVRQRRQGELHAQVAARPGRDALESMTWREFEGLAAEVFRRQGYRVAERGGDGPDGGVDLELHMGSDKYLVQCKQWKVSKVGVATVRELYGVMTAERAVGGFVVASGDFTDDALQFAEGRSIKLVSTQSLLKMIAQNQGTAARAEPVDAAPNCPKCGSKMVQRTAKKGDKAGAKFWGCSQYPACRGIRA
jgi:restriction system protein